jgi:hypothetical protein
MTWDISEMPGARNVSFFEMPFELLHPTMAKDLT